MLGRTFPRRTGGRAIAGDEILILRRLKFTAPGFQHEQATIPWFWNDAVLARLAMLLPATVFAAYAARLVANIYWPFH